VSRWWHAVIAGVIVACLVIRLFGYFTIEWTCSCRPLRRPVSTMWPPFRSPRG